MPPGSMYSLTRALAQSIRAGQSRTDPAHAVAETETESETAQTAATGSANRRARAYGSTSTRNDAKAFCRVSIGMLSSPPRSTGGGSSPR